MIKQKTLTKVQPALFDEIKLLRSAVIGWIGRDAEGQYNQKFVEQVLESSKEKDIYKFKDKKSFLKSLNA